MLGRRLTNGLAIALIAFFVGCGAEGAHSQPTAQLTGSVKIGGQPIPADADGTIDFHPTGGGQAHPTSVKIQDGKYDAPNVPHGKVLVLFNIGRFTGRTIREDGGNPFQEKENLVPLAKQQGVEIDVSGDDEVNFDL